MTMFKKVYLKNWTLGVSSGRLDSGLLHSGHFERLDTWSLDDWTIGLWTSGRLDSILLDSRRLYAWTQDSQTLGLWTLGASIFFPFLVTPISFLLLVNVEVLIISSTLRLIYYGFVERTVNDCYNSNLLQMILKFKFPSDTTNWS